MNILRTLFRTFLLMIVVAAFAIDAAQAGQPAGDTRIDCRHRYITQADAARLLGTRNFSQTYARRQTLYANVARACAGRRGVVTLTIQANRAPAPPARER